MDGMLSGDEVMNMGIASIHQAAMMVTTVNCLLRSTLPYLQLCLSPKSVT